MEPGKSLSDTELLGNLRSASSMNESIKYMYKTYFDSLSQYVINNNGSHQDAEDIFQEIMVTFIELVQTNKFRGDSSVKTFLYSLNRHTWLNELRRRGRSLVRERKYEGEEDKEETDVSHLIMEREAKEILFRLVAGLGDICKKILLQFYYENLSIKEILLSMHYENEQVVRNKKYKCLKQLEQLIMENAMIKQTMKNLLHG